MLSFYLSLLEDESDRDIFTKVYRRYEQKVLSIALSILKNKYDAEDAAVEAWIKVALHFSTAKKYISHSPTAFRAWLTIVAKNAALDERRKRKNDPEPLEPWDMPIFDNIEEGNELHILTELICSMPEQTRALLEMRITEEFDYKEIGASLHCSAGAAQRRFSRAVKALRNRVEAEVEQRKEKEKK